MENIEEDLNLLNNDQIFIDFTSDYGFKVTFGNEKNTLFLRKALQALISSPTPIVAVTFVKTTIEGLTKDSKGGIFDLVCEDEKGDQFIVEMQVGGFPNIMQRLKFYAWHKFNTLVEKGNYRFDNLPKIFCIAILDKTTFSDLEHYHNTACIKNQEGKSMDLQTTYITIELSKFKLQAQDCQNDLEKLIFTIKNIKKMNKVTQFPEFWTEEWLKIAISELDKRSLTPDQRMQYSMTLVNNAFAIDKENAKIEAARIEGEARGKAEGEARGEARGKAEGEKMKAIEAIQNLIKMGFDNEMIAQALNTSPDFVDKIRSSRQ